MTMTTATNSGHPILTTEQVATLLVEPALAAAVASACSSVITLDASSLRVPLVTADPAASWTAEGAEIVPSDASLAELKLTPAKIAGLSIVSNELAADTSPAAAEVVGAGLARDIARQLDRGFCGNLGGVAPPGLDALTGVTVVDAPRVFVDGDPFETAISEAQQVGATLTHWLTGPTAALQLSTAKEGSTSVRHLLSPDPTVPTRRTVAGLPVLVSPAVTAGVTWGIDQARSLLVIRSDATVTADDSPFYTSDRTAIKAILRCAYGWPHAASIIKIVQAAA